MLPRVPNAPQGRGGQARRRLAPCKFATGVEIAHYLQQEVVIEGVLHVSAAQAGTCLERFGDIDAMPAPSLPPLEDLLAQQAPAGGVTAHGATSAKTTASGTTSSSGLSLTSPFAIAAIGSPAKAGPAGQPPAPFSRASSASERIVNEAFCLATPPDNPGESNSPLRQQPQPGPTARPAATAAASRSSTGGQGAGGSPLSERLRLSTARPQLRGGSSTGGLETAEELLQLEGAAATYTQYAAMLHANEVLQASAAVRRQRRRALIKLLRKTREETAAGLSALQESRPGQLLASISASIGTLASWDDEGPAAAAAAASPSGGSDGSTSSNSSCRAGRRGGSSKRAAIRSSGYSSSGSDDTDVEWDAAGAKQRMDE